jgi:drug/metabolite transporter (DMT)-like permease
MSAAGSIPLPRKIQTMLYLFLAVACSVALGFIFKLFARYGIDGFQAIVFNYFVCVLCGWLHLGSFPMNATNSEKPWFPYTLILGFIFISGFNCAALTVRYFGVTISQIMQRMSILMTVPFALLVYGESGGWGKITGFLLALGSIVLVNWPSRPGDSTDIPVEGKESTKRMIWIPLLTWILAGVIEILFIRVQKEGLADTNDPAFICNVFGTAGAVGFLLAVVGWFRGRMVFSWRNVVAGVVLGIPNYGSMLFLLMALGSGLEGSLVFPLVNVSIIFVTTIGAVWLFQERLSRVNWLGIALALAAIGLIST